jgi:hypothetical protein
LTGFAGAEIAGDPAVEVVSDVEAGEGPPMVCPPKLKEHPERAASMIAGRMTLAREYLMALWILSIKILSQELCLKWALFLLSYTNCPEKAKAFLKILRAKIEQGPRILEICDEF